MKKTALLALCLTTIATAISCTQNNQITLTEVTDNVIYPEAVIPYQDMLLSTNFGVTEFNPLNAEGKGYITTYKNGVNTIFIPNDGNLNAPKGMAIKDGMLFISDVNKIVVYNLDSLAAPAQTIVMPEGEDMINDIAFLADDMYVTSTITGNILKYSAISTDSLHKATATIYTNIPGANGILIKDGTMYVASFDPNSTPQPNNLIYAIDMAEANIAPKALLSKPGLYDGLDLSTDGKMLYFSNWADKEIGRIELETNTVTIAAIAENNKIASGGDITIYRDSIAVPDLLESRIVLLPVF